MGQVLHGCATTTHAVRAAIQRSKAPIAQLAEQHGLVLHTVFAVHYARLYYDAGLPGSGAQVP